MTICKKIKNKKTETKTKKKTSNKIQENILRLLNQRYVSDYFVWTNFLNVKHILVARYFVNYCFHA